MSLLLSMSANTRRREEGMLRNLSGLEIHIGLYVILALDLTTPSTPALANCFPDYKQTSAQNLPITFSTEIQVRWLLLEASACMEGGEKCMLASNTCGPCIPYCSKMIILYHTRNVFSSLFSPLLLSFFFISLSLSYTDSHKRKSSHGSLLHTPTLATMLPDCERGAEDEIYEIDALTNNLYEVVDLVGSITTKDLDAKMVRFSTPGASPPQPPKADMRGGSQLARCTSAPYMMRWGSKAGSPTRINSRQTRRSRSARPGRRYVPCLVVRRPPKRRLCQLVSIGPEELDLIENC